MLTKEAISRIGGLCGTVTAPYAENKGLEREPMKRQHKRKLTVRVTPQTAYNLERLAAMAGLKGPGRVVDKLVREKMIALHPQA